MVLGACVWWLSQIAAASLGRPSRACRALANRGVKAAAVCIQELNEPRARSGATIAVCDKG